MLTKEQRYIVVGLMAQLQHQRAALDEAEEFATTIIKSLGATDSDDFNTVLSAVQESVYNENEGDNPEKAADRLLEHLGLEVENATPQS